MDGRRGAKSRVDREGGWERDKEVDGRKPSGRRGKTLARQSPPPQGSGSAFSHGER